MNYLKQNKMVAIYVEADVEYKPSKYIKQKMFIDSGADICLAKKEVFIQHKWKRTKTHRIRVTGFNEHMKELDIIAENVKFILDKTRFKLPIVYQENNMKQQIILGNNFLDSFKTQVIKQETISLLTPCGKWIVLKRIVPVKSISINNIRTERQTNLELLKKKYLEALKINFGEHPMKLWEKEKIYAEIKLINPNEIIRNRPIRYSPTDQKELEIQIKELLTLGLIKESKSPHSSPAFLVRNHNETKRGKARMVIDYRELNKKTIFDGYFLPYKRNLINKTSNKRWFSKFDCKSGYWQIKLTPESRCLTAFSVPQGHYEWIVLPFGLRTAPQIFQRRMDKIFREMNDFCLVYIDDILIFSDSLTDHIKHLEDFIKTIRKHGILLSERKSEVFKNKIEYLGYIIDSEGIQLQDHISTKIKNFKETLENKKEVQQFLGIINYASDYIKDLPKLRKPLQDLIKKNRIFEWTKEHTNIIKLLKTKVENLPKLRLPKDTDQLELFTDASDIGWGAVLVAFEKDDIDKENPLICGYGAGTWKPNEKNYHINEKELLAVKLGIKRFHYHLLPVKFIVRTDNTQVRSFIFNKIDPLPELNKRRNWQAFFSCYDFVIKNISGTKNVLADFLSRENGQG